MAYEDSRIVANHQIRANSKSPNEPDVVLDMHSGFDEIPASPLTIEEIIEVLLSIEPYINQIEKQSV